MAKSGSGTNDHEKLNKAYNEFLRVRPLDHDILEKYADTLCKGGEEFARTFYNYLQEFPDTAKVLADYTARGGDIESLVRTQTGHLFDLIGADLGDGYASKMQHIGEVHADRGIEPVWIMGAYLLYLRHLQLIIRDHRDIKDAHRASLEGSVTKILFRDMGLMLEGYWDASHRNSSK